MARATHALRAVFSMSNRLEVELLHLVRVPTSHHAKWPTSSWVGVQSLAGELHTKAGGAAIAVSMRVAPEWVGWGSCEVV